MNTISHCHTWFLLSRLALVELVQPSPLSLSIGLIAAYGGKTQLLQARIFAYQLGTNECKERDGATN